KDGNWSAGRCFRRNVSDYKTMRSTGEPAVCKKCHSLPNAVAAEQARVAQHLRHPRAAPRSYIRDDKYSAVPALNVNSCVHRLLFIVENPCRHLVMFHFDPGYFRHRTCW